MNISVQKRKSEEIKSDVLCAFLFEASKQLPASVQQADKKMDGFISSVLADEQFQGNMGETLFIHTHEKLPAKRILVIGIGKKEKWNTENVRRAAGYAVNAAKTVKAKH